MPPVIRKSMAHSNSLVALIVVLVLEIIAQPVVHSYVTRPSRFECPVVPATCSCTFVISDIEIQCPIASEPNIIIRYQPETYAQIECAKGSEQDYMSLPTMNIGEVQTVQIRRCPLPRGQLTFESILKRIGVRGVRTLRFQSIGTDLGGPLVREYFRGLSNLERLILSGNGLSDLPPDLFSDLRNLTWLDLSSNHVHLPSDIFTNQEKLEFLELGHNHLTRLEPHTFRNQKRLKHLNLWSNNLQNLTRNQFEGISSISDLDLSSNKLTALAPDVFHSLANLRDINLGSNNFTELSEGLFAENKQLQKIRLLENRRPIESLPSGFLANLPALEDVRIRAYVRNIPSNLFAGSENIRNISLSGNEIETLPGDLFANQSSLVDLDLSRNKLIRLPDEIFANTESLIVLNLANNKLVNITSTIFSRLGKLDTLSLQNNNLLNIDHRAFAGMKNLRFVELQNNHLSFNAPILNEGEIFEAGSPLQFATELQSLNLRNNSIGHISRDWIFDMVKLRTLDLSFNNITMLSIRDLQFLSSDIDVNLSHNAIEEIDFLDILFMDPTAGRRISIDVSENPIVCNCVLTRFVQFMQGSIAEKMQQNIQVTTNGLKCVEPENLKDRQVTQVLPKELVCDLDPISSDSKRCPAKCSCQVRPYDTTLIVNCSNAGLLEIPSLPLIPNLPYIELHVENNNLTALPHNDQPGYQHVSEIHARYNNISQFTMENLPANLSRLDLSNNALSWINTTVLTAINSTKGLRHLALGNNPWRCDCDARDLLSFVFSNLKRIQDLNSMKCISGDKLSSLSSSDLCPEDQAFLIAACILATFGLICGILASLYYRFQTEIKIWLYAHNMCLWFVTEEELDKDKKYDAFISYSHKDEEFIVDALLPNLENCPNPYKLCLHERDWIIGDFIPNQIIRSVEESKRTVVVLSPNFLESVWSRMEFQAAHKAALQEGRARVIVIIYGDIGPTDNLDSDLKSYLNMNTYVKWGDPWFWKKLRYALPHPQSAISKGLMKNSVKNPLDDKLELIKPVPTTPPPLTTPPAEQASKTIMTTPKLNGTIGNGMTNGNLRNGLNGHVNGAFIINTNAKQSDV